MLKSNNVRGSDRRRGSHGNNGSTPGLRSLLNKILVRTLDEDLVAQSKDWLANSGLHRQLDREGYRLRWVDRQGVIEKLHNGWEYVTISHLIWWRRRIRRPTRPQIQYLMKRSRALPS
jgi:hypothetical protein